MSTEVNNPNNPPDHKHKPKNDPQPPKTPLPIDLGEGVELQSVGSPERKQSLSGERPEGKYNSPREGKYDSLNGEGEDELETQLKQLQAQLNLMDQAFARMENLRNNGEPASLDYLSQMEQINREIAHSEFLLGEITKRSEHLGAQIREADERLGELDDKKKDKDQIAKQMLEDISSAEQDVSTNYWCDPEKGYKVGVGSGALSFAPTFGSIQVSNTDKALPENVATKSAAQVSPHKLWKLWALKGLWMGGASFDANVKQFAGMDGDNPLRIFGRSLLAVPVLSLYLPLIETAKKYPWVPKWMSWSNVENKSAGVKALHVLKSAAYSVFIMPFQLAGGILNMGLTLGAGLIKTAGSYASLIFNLLATPVRHYHRYVVSLWKSVQKDLKTNRENFPNLTSQDPILKHQAQEALAAAKKKYPGLKDGDVMLRSVEATKKSFGLRGTKALSGFLQVINFVTTGVAKFILDGASFAINYSTSVAANGLQFFKLGSKRNPKERAIKFTDNLLRLILPGAFVTGVVLSHGVPFTSMMASNLSLSSTAVLSFLIIGAVAAISQVFVGKVILPLMKKAGVAYYESAKEINEENTKTSKETYRQHREELALELTSMRDRIQTTKGKMEKLKGTQAILTRQASEASVRELDRSGSLASSRRSGITRQPFLNRINSTSSGESDETSPLVEEQPVIGERPFESKSKVGTPEYEADKRAFFAEAQERRQNRDAQIPQEVEVYKADEDGDSFTPLPDFRRKPLAGRGRKADSSDQAELNQSSQESNASLASYRRASETDTMLTTETEAMVTTTPGSRVTAGGRDSKTTIGVGSNRQLRREWEQRGAQTPPTETPRPRTPRNGQEPTTSEPVLSASSSALDTSFSSR